MNKFTALIVYFNRGVIESGELMFNTQEEYLKVLGNIFQCKYTLDELEFLTIEKGPREENIGVRDPIFFNKDQIEYIYERSVAFALGPSANDKTKIFVLDGQHVIRTTNFGVGEEFFQGVKPTPWNRA